MRRISQAQQVGKATWHGRRFSRRGVAAVEFALCLPLVVLLLLGILEVGRITQVANILWNSARESARDASLGQDNLQTVAANLLTYLRSALPSVFNASHSTTISAATISLPANTIGYTCWDNTGNQELFTITFTDITQPSVTDPTGMAKLDHYQIGVQVPYTTVGWSPATQITGVSRISVTVDWVCMVDAPFQITPSLPAE